MFPGIVKVTGRRARSPENLSMRLFAEASDNGLLASHLRRAIFSFGSMLSLTYIRALKVAWQNTDVLVKRK